MALSHSVDWHELFYIAVLSIILAVKFFGNLTLTRSQLLTWTSNFRCFEALGVRPRASSSLHVLVGGMGNDYSYFRASEPWAFSLAVTQRYFLHFKKYWKNTGLVQNISNAQLSPTLAWPLFEWLKILKKWRQATNISNLPSWQSLRL